MKLPRLLCPLLFLTAPVLAGDPPASGETYEVHLARPVKAGAKFKIEARVAFQMESKMKMGDLPGDDEKVDIATKFTGELTVVGVTAKGLASELRLKLTAVESFDEGTTAHFFKAGDVIVMKHGPTKDDITVNDEVADDEQAELADAVLHVADEDEATDDEAFGTRNKVKVGEEWPADRDVLVKEMARQHLEGLKPADFKAVGRLADTTKVNDEPALRFVCDMNFDSSDASMPNLSEGLKTKHMSADVRSEMDLPVDPSSLAMHARTLMNFEVKAEGQTRDDEGQKIPTTLTVKRRAAVDATETPLP